LCCVTRPVRSSSDAKPENVTTKCRMTIIAIKDFIMTGQIGPVQIGSIRDEVIQLLGESEI